MASLIKLKVLSLIFERKKKIDGTKLGFDMCPTDFLIEITATMESPYM